jgi:hypothetical protein
VNSGRSWEVERSDDESPHGGVASRDDFRTTRYEKRPLRTLI